MKFVVLEIIDVNGGLNVNRGDLGLNIGICRWYIVDVLLECSYVKVNKMVDIVNGIIFEENNLFGSLEVEDNGDSVDEKLSFDVEEGLFKFSFFLDFFKGYKLMVIFDSKDDF